MTPWTILECPKCQYAKVNPPPSRESRPEFYTAEKHEVRSIKKKRPPLRQFAGNMKRLFKRLSSRDKYSFFYNKLKDNVKSGGSVLDVACADGAFMEHAKKSFKFTGIEISEDQAVLAKKRNEDCEILTGDYLTKDFEGRKYDAITMLSLLEHLDDPLMALEKSYELLNDKGLLVLKTVNYSCVNRYVMNEKWTGLRPPDHVVYFNPKNLKRIVQKVGFSNAAITSQPFSDNMYCQAWK